jgi:ribosomal protein S15P/S13E
MVTKDEKLALVSTYGKTDTDTGAPEVQIALFT